MTMKLLYIFSVIILLSACGAETSTENAATNNSVTEKVGGTAATKTTEVSISNAWVREPAPGQKIGAAYMTLESPQDSQLVYAEAKGVAGSVEIHSMSMDNGVMRMRMLEALTLEAGKPTELTPGGLHLMMFDLEKPLKAGEEVAFRLCFEDADGNITHQNVTLPIQAQ